MQKLIIGIAPNMSVEIHSDSIKQVIEQAAFWNSLPATCPVCNAPVAFFHRDPKDNDYWGLNCTGPVTHESNFGVYKTTEKGFYYKGARSWAKAYDAYQADGEQQSTNGNQQSPAPAARQEFPEQPLARNLHELITAKQLGMIRALAREANISEGIECNSVMKCAVDELSKAAASDFIKHLQGVERRPQTAQAAPAMTPEQQLTSNIPPAPPAPPAPPIAPRPAEDDDIPF